SSGGEVQLASSESSASFPLIVDGDNGIFNVDKVHMANSGPISVTQQSMLNANQSGPATVDGATHGGQLFIVNSGGLNLDSMDVLGAGNISVAVAGPIEVVPEAFIRTSNGSIQLLATTSITVDQGETTALTRIQARHGNVTLTIHEPQQE